MRMRAFRTPAGAPSIPVFLSSARPRKQEGAVSRTPHTKGASDFRFCLLEHISGHLTKINGWDLVLNPTHEILWSRSGCFSLRGGSESRAKLRHMYMCLRVKLWQYTPTKKRLLGASMSRPSDIMVTSGAVHDTGRRLWLSAADRRAIRQRPSAALSPPS